MKALSKPLVTWLLSLFNVGVYSISDDIDSLIFRLNLAGLEKHANTILILSQSIEAQQSIIILLDSLKCVCMVISIVLLILANQQPIQAAYQWLKKQLLNTRLFWGNKTKTFRKFFTKLFKP